MADKVTRMKRLSPIERMIDEATGYKLLTLTEKRTRGFVKLKKGCIHLRCPGCGRKQSNVRRAEDYDPPDAVLVEVLCPNCGADTKDLGAEWFDRKGNASSRQEDQHG